MKKRAWISWERHRRNRTLSAAVRAELFEFDWDVPRPLRYIALPFKTLLVLLRKRPDILFVQNPSLVLSFLAVAIGSFIRLPVVVDAHNAGLRPFEGRYAWANHLAEFIIRHSALTIVSNSGLASIVLKANGTPAVVPDPLPVYMNVHSNYSLRSERNILFICTWAQDEPYIEVIKAALDLDKEITIYITGNSKHDISSSQHLPENIVLTGFLPEDQYLSLLSSCDAVIDLTTREDCLVCGAYEAVAAGKPMLLSSTRALRSFFHKGALYTDNTARDIACQITELFTSLSRLQTEVISLRNELLDQWEQHHQQLEALLADMGLRKKLTS